MSAPQLIECVPNISEGRDASVIDAVCAAVRRTPGVMLLDRSSDADHNRSVITFAGVPEAVVDAALALVGVALRQIDVSAHDGVHPRVGAVDVLPFVPLTGIDLEATAAVARDAATRIAARYELPVYLYGAAAERPERTRLATVRNRGRDALADGLATDPALAPDRGPARLHPSGGALAVGCRPFLVAYNVVLDSDDLPLARQIARAVRESSGGLPGVQALGFRLGSRGKVQVSLNLVDLQTTGLAAAHEAVRAAAETAGVRALEGELVGLAPSAALNGALADTLGIVGLAADSDLESRLLTQLLEPGRCALPLLERLASADETPGGGAVVGMDAALAAAQIAMICRLQTVEAPWHAELLGLAAESWRVLLGLIDDDAAGFRELLAAWRLPRTTRIEREQRTRRITVGRRAAAIPPLEILRRVARLIAGCAPLIDAVKPALAPDLAIALDSARAALAGAARLVRINLAGEPVPLDAPRLASEAQQLLDEGRATAARLIDALDQGLPEWPRTKAPN